MSLSTAKLKFIHAHKLRDHRLEGWHQEIAGRWSYRRLAADPVWREGWISFDAIVWNPYDGLVYCGLNSIDGDLLYTFDPHSSPVRNAFAHGLWTDAFDVKIHRTILGQPA